MKDAILELLGSKKFLMTLAGIAVWAFGQFGLEVQAEVLLPVLALIAALILGQGVADIGKPAAKVNQATHLKTLEAQERLALPPSTPPGPSAT